MKSVEASLVDDVVRWRKTVVQIAQPDLALQQAMASNHRKSFKNQKTIKE